MKHWIVIAAIVLVVGYIAMPNLKNAPGPTSYQPGSY